MKNKVLRHFNDMKNKVLRHFTDRKNKVLRHFTDMKNKVFIIDKNKRNRNNNFLYNIMWKESIIYFNLNFNKKKTNFLLSNIFHFHFCF